MAPRGAGEPKAEGQDTWDMGPVALSALELPAGRSLSCRVSRETMTRLSSQETIMKIESSRAGAL